VQDQNTFEETFAKDAHHAADQAADEAKRGKIHKMTNAEYEAMQTNRQKAVDIQMAAKQKETNDESGPHLSSPGVSASPDPNSSPYRKGQESTKGLESTRSAAGGKDKKGKKKKGGLFKCARASSTRRRARDYPRREHACNVARARRCVTRRA
jgi:hypothetical protein